MPINTNNKSPEEFFKKIRGISLSQQARTKIRKHLDTQLEQYPDAPLVRIDDTTRLIESEGTSFGIRSPLLLFTKRKTMFIPLLIALLLTGGTSYAAESAVPGDVLYPIKVDVNERVANLLTISDEAQANWEVRLAERRINEVAKLSDDNALNSETKTQLAEQIATHIENAFTRANALDASGHGDRATGVRTDVQKSLRENADIIREQVLDANKDYTSGSGGIWTEDRYASLRKQILDAGSKDDATSGGGVQENANTPTDDRTKDASSGGIWTNRDIPSGDRETDASANYQGEQRPPVSTQTKDRDDNTQDDAATQYDR